MRAGRDGSTSEEANEGKPFPSYARILAHRGTTEGESRYSWTVDFADKRKQARAEIQPLLEEAAKIREVIVALKVQLRELKRSDGYTSFWQYIWYAEGVGVVKQTLLFDERAGEHNIPNCHGAAYSARGVSNVAYDDYIDDPH